MAEMQPQSGAKYNIIMQSQDDVDACKALGYTAAKIRGLSERDARAITIAINQWVRNHR